MTRKQLSILVTVVGWMFCASKGWGQVNPSDGRALQHVFPLFADGKLNDGTSYRSSFVSTSVVSATNGVCDVNLVGMTTTMLQPDGEPFVPGTETIDGGGLGGWFEARSQGVNPFQSGYLTMGCTTLNTAQVAYSFYTPNGIKLSEATVFSSSPGTRLQLFADHRGFARLGLAIANDTAAPVTVTVLAFGLTNAPPLTTPVTIPAKSNYVKFLNEILLNIPNEYIGIVQLRSQTPVSAIGLRFTGTAFTTIPAAVLIP